MAAKVAGIVDESLGQPARPWTTARIGVRCAGRSSDSRARLPGLSAESPT